MIDKDIAIVDIDPVSWRNLGRLRKELIPEKKILTVIMEAGNVVAAFDESRGKPVDISDTSGTPTEMARKLYEEREGLDQVRVLEREALKEFDREISTPSPHLDRDEYLHWARALRRAKYGDRLAEYPPCREESEPFSHSRLKAFVEGHDNSAFFIGVFAGETPFFNLIFQIKNRKVVLLTTWDAFGGEALRRDYAYCAGRIHEKFGPVSAGILMDRELLAGIFRAGDKAAVIDAARESGGFSGRISGNNDLISLIGLALFFWPAMYTTVYVNRV